MALSDLQAADAPAASPVTGRDGRGGRRRMRRLTRRDVLVLVVALGVPILLEVALIWGPTIASIVLSFASWNGVGEVTWVGTRNYETITTIYPPFWPAIRHNVLWLLFLGVVASPLGLFMAVLLDKQIRFTRFYQTALYMPVVLSLAVVGFIAQLIFSRDYGVVNGLIGNTANPIDWLGNPDLNIWAMLALAGWRHVGYVMVLYLAGLKSVDPSLRESAALDGANQWRTFWSVVFPTLRPVNVIVLVITVIEALRAFDIVYVVNQGRNGLELLSVLVFDNIVGEASRIGFGSALAVILFAIAFGFIVTYLSKILREDQQ